jgi:hypothetical protein
VGATRLRATRCSVTEVAKSLATLVENGRDIQRPGSRRLVRDVLLTVTAGGECYSNR